MPSELISLFMTGASSVITALLGMNLFFVRDFMKRMEKSIDALSKSISDHGDRLGEVDKSVTEKISRLDERIADIDRIRKRYPRS